MCLFWFFLVVWSHLLLLIIHHQELGFGVTVKENAAELLHRLIVRILETDDTAALEILMRRLEGEAAAAAENTNDLDLDVEDMEGILEEQDLQELDVTTTEEVQVAKFAYFLFLAHEMKLFAFHPFMKPLVSMMTEDIRAGFWSSLENDSLFLSTIHIERV